MVKAQIFRKPQEITEINQTSHTKDCCDFSSVFNKIGLFCRLTWIVLLLHAGTHGCQQLLGVLIHLVAEKKVS